MSHKDMGWHPDMPDVSIIRECAARNFIILSGDKSMERVPEERQAIIDGKCKVFMFDDSNKTRTEDWIASVLIGTTTHARYHQKDQRTAVRHNQALSHLQPHWRCPLRGKGWRRLDRRRNRSPAAATNRSRTPERKHETAPEAAKRTKLCEYLRSAALNRELIGQVSCCRNITGISLLHSVQSQNDESIATRKMI
jgi:hypothetical protein